MSDVRAVRIPDTPTGLVLRADDYLAELQRELELVRLSRNGRGHDPVEVLASISAILASCAQVRFSVRGDAENCSRDGHATFDAVFRVHAATRSTAEKLRHLIGRAAHFGRRGLLLTVPPEPDVERFLHDWLGAVIAQLGDTATSEPAPMATWATADIRPATVRTERLATHEPPTEGTSTMTEIRRDGAIRTRLEPTLSASRRARELLRHVEDRWGLEDQCEAAELPLSELVTNAVLHARTQIDIAVCLVDESLRVEVCDQLPELHSPRSRDPGASTGRGLELVGAIADRWGVVRQPTGKTVWFEVDPPAPDGHD